MSDFLVDTNHLSVVVTEDYPLRARLLRHVQFDDTFSIAAPALTEFLFGIQMAPRAQQNMGIWTRISVLFLYYEIQIADAEYAATLQVDLRRRGWQINTVDALIATIALRYDLTLLTTDKDFSRVPDLKVENWLMPTGNVDE
jgi:predicted nucleic acid-binding protein